MGHWDSFAQQNNLLIQTYNKFHVFTLKDFYSLHIFLKNLKFKFIIVNLILNNNASIYFLSNLL